MTAIETVDSPLPPDISTLVELEIKQSCPVDRAYQLVDDYPNLARLRIAGTIHTRQEIKQLPFGQMIGIGRGLGIEVPPPPPPHPQQIFTIEEAAQRARADAVEALTRMLRPHPVVAAEPPPPTIQPPTINDFEEWARHAPAVPTPIPVDDNTVIRGERQEPVGAEAFRAPVDIQRFITDMYNIQRERRAQTHERTTTEIVMENPIPMGDEWRLPHSARQWHYCLYDTI